MLSWSNERTNVLTKLRRIRVPTQGLPSRWIFNLWYLRRVEAWLFILGPNIFLCFHKGLFTFRVCLIVLWYRSSCVDTNTILCMMSIRDPALPYKYRGVCLMNISFLNIEFLNLALFLALGPIPYKTCNKKKWKVSWKVVVREKSFVFAAFFKGKYWQFGSHS